MRFHRFPPTMAATAERDRVIHFHRVPDVVCVVETNAKWGSDKSMPVRFLQHVLHVLDNEDI